MRMTRALVVAAAGLLSIQLMPMAMTNPPVETEVPATPAAHAVLRRACYDCHSNETRWPWYAYVAPASWLVARDVHLARTAVNFSTWHRIDPVRRRSVLRVIVHRINGGHMPPWFYVALHREAKLSNNDRAILRDWAISVARGPAARQMARHQRERDGVFSRSLRNVPRRQSGELASDGFFETMNVTTTLEQRLLNRRSGRPTSSGR